MARLPDGALLQRAAAGLAAAVLDLLGGGEQARAQRRGAREGLHEAVDVDHLDPDADDGHPRPRPYSTVTDLARLRGWSTSWPSWVASSHANSCSGTTATSGWSSTGTWGSVISTSA